jgi:uncharacterized membrane protein YdjX (TVP38/TMEM64 family)
VAPRGKKVALVVAVAAGMLLAWRLGVFTSVSEPRAFAEWLRTLGVLGWVLFVLAYAALQPFGVPGTVFVLAAPLIWPWPIAFALSMTGTMAASVIGFSFSRYVARDWVSKRIPKRFEKYTAALEKNGLQTTFILRLLFWMPQALHAFLGVSKVRFWTHFWGSFLGYIPTLLVISWLGSEMFDDAGHLQPRAWPIMGSFVAFSLLLVTVLRLRNRRAAKAVTSDG